MASKRAVLDALPGDVGGITKTLQATPSEVRRHLRTLEAQGKVEHHDAHGVLVYTRVD
jgi:predicted ArsR family transcriptional regulator